VGEGSNNLEKHRLFSAKDFGCFTESEHYLNLDTVRVFEGSLSINSLSIHYCLDVFAIVIFDVHKDMVQIFKN
jgi:hypothetical protein